jgi:hypothetical protein
MCLNVFLVLTDPADPRRVLAGHIATDPRWEEAGGLDPDRVHRVGDRWMLPSRQLELFESPDDAARKIAEDQLGVSLPGLPAPRVVSEQYTRPTGTGPDPHWDLHFLYLLPGPSEPPSSELWTELRYLPVTTTPRSSFGRGHGDILELVGHTPGP